jgi:AraC-like DNA-binding protein
MQANELSDPADWVRYRATPLPAVTLMRAHFTHHAFERHSHAEYGIGLTHHGVQTFHCGRTMQTSRPGDVILLNPDQDHDGLPGPAGAYRYSMLYADAELIATLGERAAGTVSARHFRDTVIHAPRTARLLQQAIDALAQEQETLRAETLLLETFVALLLRHGETPAAARLPVRWGQERLQRVRDYLRAHADQDLSIGRLAEEAGVSRVYLSRAFRHRFGVPPHVYLNAVRLANARRLLLQGVPIAAAGVAAGFADQSHFHRRFRGAVGLSPGTWLRQMRLHAPATPRARGTAHDAP